MAPKQRIELPTVRSAGGRPYSPAVRVGEILYISGQVAMDESGQTVGRGDVLAQGRQALMNIKALVEAAGGSLDDITFLQLFVTDMRHFVTFGELRKEFFKPPYPASTVVGVTGLAQEDWLIEIQATAHLGCSR